MKIDNKMSENENKRFYEQCESIIREIMSDPQSFFFFKPVEPEIDGAPQYFQFITHPMCFYVIQEKLNARAYSRPEEFIADVNLIWTDAKYYNGEKNQVYQTAERLSKKFEILSLTLPKTISPDEKVSALQRYTEMRLKRYRQNKETHL